MAAVSVTTLATTSLSEGERRAAERFIELLKRELGDELIAVWLFGSRARGEPSGGEDSDVDLLVVTERGKENEERIRDIARQMGEEDRSLAILSPLIEDVEWLVERRAAEAFIVQEIDRDKVVLHGEPLDSPELFPTPLPREPEGMKLRSKEYLEHADEELSMGAVLIKAGMSRGVVTHAYYAMLHAARAALSEQDLFAKTHSGTWNLVWQKLVEADRLDPELQQIGTKAQGLRWAVNYEGKRVSRQQAEELLSAAERFVTAVQALITPPG